MAGDGSLGWRESVLTSRTEWDSIDRDSIARADSAERALALMLRIREGDADALRELMTLYWPGLVRYSAVMTGCSDEGEDVAQCVFVHVWETRAQWTSSGSVAGYLFRIARNIAIGRVRREEVRSRPRPEALVPRPTARSPLDLAELSEFGAALEAALRFLPARRREAFELVRFQGLSLCDAANVMGLTRRTIANHLYLGALDLAEKLRPFRD